MFRISRFRVNKSSPSARPALRPLWMDLGDDLCIGITMPEGTFCAMLFRPGAPRAVLPAAALPWIRAPSQKSVPQHRFSAAAGAQPRVAERSTNHKPTLPSVVTRPLSGPPPQIPSPQDKPYSIFLGIQSPVSHGSTCSTFL